MIGLDFRDDDHPKEECGVIGIYSPGAQAANYAFFALQALQHRGQESAGLASADGFEVVTRKKMGLVSAVFQDLHDLEGEFAIGHTRYSTTGNSEVANAGPIQGDTQHGSIAVAHNGNLVNAVKLRQQLADEGVVLKTSTDSEAIAELIVRNLHRGPEHAVAYTMQRIEGGYAVAVITKDMIIGFRDPHGIRPLMVGTVAGGYMVASESCAFAPVAGKVLQELGPGEMVIIDKKGMRFAQGVAPRRPALCLFEAIYFARPDSVMANTTLYRARQRMGEELARECPCPDADIVIPVPDSGVPAALGYSRYSGLPFEEGMMKNRYIHRTFIQPEQGLREQAVIMKLSPMEEVIRDKKVVVVDDSIVRSTTTRKIVGLLKSYGAKEVHIRITAPPIKWPCFYGIDMSTRKELVASENSIDQIREMVGAESLGYLSLEACVRAVGRPVNEFCTACFTGDYPVKVPDDLNKQMFETPHVGTLVTVGSQG